MWAAAQTGKGAGFRFQCLIACGFESHAAHNVLELVMRLIWGPYLCKDGRMRCDVMYHGRNRPKTVLWARYKLEKKLGRPLRKGETVDHKDDDKTNDRLNNLQVLSLADNVRKSATGKALVAYMRSAEGREASRLRARGEKNQQAQFSDALVIKLRRLHIRGKLDRTGACEKYGVSDRAMRNMLAGVSYSHLPGSVRLKRGRPKQY